MAKWCFEEDGQGYELEYWHFEDTMFPDQPYNITARTRFLKKGELVGHVDTTGFSTGNHLHFGLRLVDPKTLQILNYDNGYKGGVDPIPYLRKKVNHMPQISSQAKGPEKRIVLQAATPEEWIALCAIFGKDPNSVDETVQ
jgi:hypothetical protein